MSVNDEAQRLSDQIKKATADFDGRPPIEKWQPELSGDMDLRISREGSWIFKGNPINREAIVKLFATILRREDDGHYYLVTPVEKWRITVEDAPLLAHGLEVMGEDKSQVITLTLNTGETVIVGDTHPLHLGHYPDSEEPRPVVDVLHGVEARLTTAAYYDLAALAVESTDEAANDAKNGSLGVWSNGIFFKLAENS
ncbi:DUF1285 domain-containing protein [Marinobacter sp. 1Y8]